MEEIYVNIHKDFTPTFKRFYFTDKISTMKALVTLKAFFKYSFNEIRMAQRNYYFLNVYGNLILNIMEYFIINIMTTFVQVVFQYEIVMTFFVIASKKRRRQKTNKIDIFNSFYFQLNISLLCYHIIKSYETFHQRYMCIVKAFSILKNT